MTLVVVLALVAAMGLTVSVGEEPAAAAAKFSTAPTPKISGTARVGSTLTAKPGTWKPKAKLKYQWYRSGSAIKGATKSTYVLVSADKGKTIKVKVTGSKAGYTSKAKTSAATKKVAAAVPPAPRLVKGERKVRTGLAFVDVDRNVSRAKARSSMDSAVVAANGGAVVYREYRVSAGGAYDYRLEWRDLASGRSLTLKDVWSYGLDISANGRWVVYIDAGSAASDGMVTSNRFWLWDTKKNTRTRIDLRSDGKASKDADRSFCERSIDISDNGAWVVFSANAPSLSPKGAKDSFSSFAYQRSTGKVTAVPYKAGRSADCARVSNNGKVVLFPGWGGGEGIQLWDIATGKVRAIAQSAETGWSSAEPAAISADGSTLVYLSAVLTITRLGTSAATDRATDVKIKGWKTGSASDGTGYADSSVGEPVISADGTAVSFMTSRATLKWTCTGDGWCTGGQVGDAVYSLRHLKVGSGKQTTLAAPGAVAWLPLGKAAENILTTRVSVSADGRSTYSAACSRGSQANPFSVCSNRSDLFRWSTK
jgi:hypothetical protein